MGKPVVTYVRAQDEEIEAKQTLMREFAKQHDLWIVEEFSEQGKFGEAAAVMFRWLAENPEKADDCGIIVPRLGALGQNERMIRAVLAAYRELGITIYTAETGAIIQWAAPAQNLLTVGAGEFLDLGREMLHVRSRNA